MSHETGKIEVVGFSGNQIFFKYTRSADPENNSKFLVFESNPNAYWFDDYAEAQQELPLEYSESSLNWGDIA